MTTNEVERELERTAAAARPGRSVVGDVMSRLETVALPEWERAGGRVDRGRRVFVGLVGAAALVAVAVTLAVVILGTGAAVTLADVKTALAGKSRIHVRYDGGQVKESWMDLQAGRFAYVRFDGGAGLSDKVSNILLRYNAHTQVVSREPNVIYPEGEKPDPFVPKDAYEAIVAPLEERAKSAEGQAAVERHDDTLDGRTAVRFDLYGPDGLGHRMLFTQLWVDKQTHLPLRTRSRLQLGERPESGGREWAVGVYEFDVPVPVALADLGVPKETPVLDRINPKPVSEEVQKLVAAAKAARDAFPDYRSVVWRDNDNSIDTIYRQGEKRAQTRYFNIQDNGMDKEHKYSIPGPLTAARILEWVPTQPAVQTSVYDGEREYDRTNPVPYMVDNRPASVHVIAPRGFPLLNSNDWPEEILWPSMFVNGGRNMEYLGKTDDAPAGTVVLRYGGQGTQRHDFYIKPSGQHVCVKWVWWEKRDGQWRRSREYLLADFRRVNGHPVPATRIIMDYGDESRHISSFVTVEHHDVRAMKPADFPPDTFNGEKLLEGAKIESY